MRPPVLCLLLLILLPAPMLFASDSFPMRWRIMRDYESGISWRFPYEYYIPDQYETVVIRPTAQNRGLPLKLISLPIDELPAGVNAEDLAAVAAQLCGHAFEATEAYDYYGASEARPHADEDWALPGIQAALCTSNDASALVLRYLDRVSCLRLPGSPIDADNASIINSLEVMAPLNQKRWLRDRERGKAERWGEDGLLTYRAAQFLKNQRVVDSDGRLVSSRSRGQAPNWRGAWEAETPSYHVTCSVSPQRTAEIGAIMENLHRAFMGVYRPDKLPPYKMEVHIVDTIEEFGVLARSKGFNIPTGGGSITGGFFVPAHLSIYTYNSPVKNFSLSIEKVLAHEASHQFLHITCNGSRHVPTWLNEGLAVYFEAGDYTGRTPVWKPPADRLEQLRQHYERLPAHQTLFPLESYLKHYGHIPAANYAEVYLMTHFLLYGNPKGYDLFKEYWTAMKEGKNGTEEFERILMGPMIDAQGTRSKAFDTWAGMLKEWLKKGHANRVQRM